MHPGLHRRPIGGPHGSRRWRGSGDWRLSIDHAVEIFALKALCGWIAAPGVQNESALLINATPALEAVGEDLISYSLADPSRWIFVPVALIVSGMNS